MTIMTNITIDDGFMVMNAEVPSDTWTVAQAKAKLSEVIDKARRKGPQAITRNGKSAVVVDAELWENTQRRELMGSFADFILASPLRGSGLEVERLEGGVRETSL
jgi:prevent-host-death family protein